MSSLMEAYGPNRPNAMALYDSPIYGFYLIQHAYGLPSYSRGYFMISTFILGHVQPPKGVVIPITKFPPVKYNTGGVK